MISQDELIITIRHRVEHHFNGKLLVKFYIKLFQSLHVSLHFLHMSTHRFTKFQFSCSKGLEDFIRILSSFLEKHFKKILVYFIRLIVLIGMLDLRFHACNHNASDLYSIINIMVILSHFLKIRIFIVNF